MRPTSVAALYALLAAPAPRRLLVAYILAGLVFTIAFGLLVIWAVGGVDVGAGTTRSKGIADLLAGAALIALAIVIGTGRVRWRMGAEAPRTPRDWSQRLEGRLTVRTALLAGPATHVPGIFYLVALNVIVAHDPARLTGVVEVLLYNAIWFALPFAALAVCIVRPEAARELVGDIQRWSRDHSRLLVTTVCAGVGIALAVRGLVSLV